MRTKSLLSLTLLPVVLMMTGCGMTPNGIETNVPSSALTGIAMGGETPITGYTVSIYAYGTGGYGSAATLLAQQTLGTGVSSFSFGSGAYTCPQANTPLYLLVTGGNAGAGTNSNIALSVNLGTCTQAKALTALVVNEITTVSMAYALAHYFNDQTSAGYSSGADSFGGPSTTTGSTVNYSKGITSAITYTIGDLSDNNYGGVNYSVNGAPGSVVEASKILTISNLLAGCVETSGVSHTSNTGPCGKLFNYTKYYGNSTGTVLTSRPYDTLQAAVQIALNPSIETTNLYNLVPTTPAFAGGLTAAPNDWSLGVSYTTSGLGIAVPTDSIATMDIDQSNNIWFTSNAPGAVGAVEFLPYGATSFVGPINGYLIQNPTQVAIDNAGYVWMNDRGGSNIAGFLASNSGSTSVGFSLPGTTSTALTIVDDNSVNVGTLTGSTAALANLNTARSTYAATANSTLNFAAVSLAGDSVGGEAINTVNTTNSTHSYIYYDGPNSSNVATLSETLTADILGQVIFTGNDFISLRQTNGTNHDGFCIASVTACYPLTPTSSNSPTGAVVDGAGTVWVTANVDGGVFVVPITTSANSRASVYLNSAGTKVPTNELLHGSGNGGTMTNPTAISVDVAGNVWVLNSGCTTTGCTPGALVLSEIVGAATPTITPVAYNITQGTVTTGTEPSY